MSNCAVTTSASTRCLSGRSISSTRGSCSAMCRSGTRRSREARGRPAAAWVAGDRGVRRPRRRSNNSPVGCGGGSASSVSVSALARLMDQRGFEAEWPRRALRPPQGGRSEGSRHGRAPCGTRGHRPRGEPRCREPLAGVPAAVARGLITDAEIDAVLARLDAPDLAVFSPVMFTAWGRRSGLAASQSDHAFACQPTSRRTAPAKGHLP